MEIKVDSIKLVGDNELVLNGVDKCCYHDVTSVNCGEWCPLFHYEELPERKEDFYGAIEMTEGLVLIKGRTQVTLCQDRVYYTEKPLQG